MNRLVIVILAVVAIFVGLIFVMPKSPTEKTLTYQDIDVQVKNGSQVVDVRTPEEYAESHISGAINLPLDQIQAGNFGNLDKSMKNYAYCRSVNRSSQATSLLQKAGYETVDLGAMTHVVSIGGKL